MVRRGRNRFIRGQKARLKAHSPPHPADNQVVASFAPGNGSIKLAALVHRVERLRAVQREALRQAERPLRPPPPPRLQRLTALMGLCAWPSPRPGPHALPYSPPHTHAGFPGHRTG